MKTILGFRKKSDVIFTFYFTSPAMILYVVFMLVPIILSFYYGMLKWDGASLPKFIGFKNFIYLISNKSYHTVLKNTLLNVFVSTFIKIPLALLFAYLVYRTSKGFNLFRFAIFLPVVISSTAIALMFTILLNGDIGPINRLLEAMNLSSLTRIWLGDPKIVVYSVIMPQVWQNIGLHTVIFLAALQGIPKEILESASIDGAHSFRLFRSIVFPFLWEALQISIILNVTGALKAFEYSWILTRGGPGIRSSFLGVMVYSKAFEEGKIGLASAISVSILVYSLVFTILFKWLTKKNSLDN